MLVVFLLAIAFVTGYVRLVQRCAWVEPYAVGPPCCAYAIRGAAPGVLYVQHRAVAPSAAGACCTYCTYAIRVTAWGAGYVRCTVPAQAAEPLG